MTLPRPGVTRSLPSSAALAAGALLITVVGACRPPRVVGLRHDPTFTYENLAGGSFAVGGVTWLLGDEPPPPATRSQFETLLASALMETYPRVRVVPAGAVVATLGEEAHGELLARYRLTAELDSTQLAELGARVSNVRYLVLCRIDAETTDSSEAVTQDTTRRGYEEVKLSASRTVTAGFQVYDVSLGRSVWKGQMDKTRSASNTYVEPRGFLESLVTSLLRGEHKYPNPPQRVDVLRQLFEEFTERLPEPP